eukprot:982128-Amphidinium_carterae.1
MPGEANLFQQTFFQQHFAITQVAKLGKRFATHKLPGKLASEPNFEKGYRHQHVQRICEEMARGTPLAT